MYQSFCIQSVSPSNVQLIPRKMQQTIFLSWQRKWKMFWRWRTWGNECAKIQFTNKKIYRNDILFFIRLLSYANILFTKKNINNNVHQMVFFLSLEGKNMKLFSRITIFFIRATYTLQGIFLFFFHCNSIAT